jgi:hypothetical protein
MVRLMDYHELIGDSKGASESQPRAFSFSADVDTIMVVTRSRDLAAIFAPGPELIYVTRCLKTVEVLNCVLFVASLQKLNCPFPAK